MPNLLTIHPQSCVACKTCEIVCSLVKTGECNPKSARIRVVTFDKEGYYSPTVCMQCREAWCAEACPTSAITRNGETGALIVNEDKCVGCRMCTLACPFGQIVASITTGKACKCDLCGGDPTCVKYCPTQAIKFEKTDSFPKFKQKAMVGKVMAGSHAEE